MMLRVGLTRERDRRFQPFQPLAIRYAHFHMSLAANWVRASSIMTFWAPCHSFLPLEGICLFYEDFVRCVDASCLVIWTRTWVEGRTITGVDRRDSS